MNDTVFSSIEPNTLVMRRGIILLSAINFCKCLDLIATCHGLISALIDIDLSSWNDISTRLTKKKSLNQTNQSFEQTKIGPFFKCLDLIATCHRSALIDINLSS